MGVVDHLREKLKNQILIFQAGHAQATSHGIDLQLTAKYSNILGKIQNHNMLIVFMYV